MINAAIVGAGIWGQTLVRSVQGRSAAIRFVRGVTRTPARAADFAREVGIPIDDDYAALLADPGVDAVVLATPHSQHVEQIVQAAAAGKHVFVEKPLALEATEAARACHAAEAAGIVLALGHNRRCLPAFLRLRDLLAEGALGQLLHVEGNFSGPSAYRQSREGWRADGSESPAGGMTGKGIHITDLMIALLGPVAAVSAVSRRQVLDFGMDDTTLTMLRFAGGQTGMLATLTATPDDWRLQVFGSRGWAEIRDQRRLSLRLLDGGDRGTEDFGPPETERAILEAFAAAIAEGRPFPVSPDEAIANTALLEAITRAARSDGPVAVAMPQEVRDQS